jgi:hypothetical protein
VLGAPYEGSGGSPYLVKVTHVPAAGDFNDDGQIDANDLAAWSANVGKTSGASLRLGDADKDDDADGADFLARQRGLGESLSVATSAATVPEPSALTLAAMVSAYVRRTLRGRRHGPPRYRSRRPPTACRFVR